LKTSHDQLASFTRQFFGANFGHNPQIKELPST